MQVRTLLIALALLSALFVGFLWWVYLSSAGTLPLWVPLIGSLLPLLVFGAGWGFQRFRARRASDKLESAIAEDSARERRAAPDARSAELDRLRSEFERAVKALKSSKLGDGSQSAGGALYRLPWYAIIGPPASGKTTVLRNSGLKFPYLPGTGDRLKGIGGTRNCDWWLTNHAILLDTAGRWSLEEDERDEWLAFLDLLKKHRGERPLNGIIAAISVAGDPATSISGAAEDELKDIALRMRERLDEISGRLGVALPVYLLFTKCDLIHGFVESFRYLTGERRKQIWGFTAPVLQGARRDPGNYFAQQFDLLQAELEERALACMSDEVDVQTMPAIYEFPAQFAALKEKLRFFVDELFDASAYRETPLLRGAYFTSGTQEGAPADLLLENMLGELDLRPAQSELREEKKSYFLHDMLMRVVFEDRALATTSDVELVRQHWKRRAITATLFTAAFSCAALSTDSCQHNLRAIAHTESSLAQEKAARARSESTGTRPQELPELLALEKDVAGYMNGGRGLIDVGLYQGDALSPVLERYYHNALLGSLIRPLLQHNQASLLTRTQQLQVTDDEQRSSEQTDAIRNELRDALSLQLLLTGPREACTPKPLARRDFIVTRLLTLWKATAPDDATSDNDRRQLIGRYLELASQETASTTLAREPRAIDQARRALGEDDRVARLLQRVIAGYTEPQTLTSLAGSSLALQARGTLSKAFSRDGWQRINNQISASDFRENDGDWVFGCDARDDAARAEQDSETFRQNYLKRYEKSWRDFLVGVRGRAPENVQDAETMLGELVARPGVLGGLLAAVRDNTTLPAPPPSLGLGLGDSAAKVGAQLVAATRTTGSESSVSGALKQAVTAQVKQATPETPSMTAPLQRAFQDYAAFDQAAQAGAATTLDSYRRGLESVLVAVRTYQRDDSKVDELAVAAQTALDNTETLLHGQNSSWTPQLRELLVPVLTGTLALVRRDRGAQLASAYCAGPYGAFQRDLAGRFPFKPDAKEAVSMAAFERFFQPGSGSLATFQNTQLAGYVSAEGGRFRFNGSQARTVLRDEVLDFLQRAAAISQAFFPEAGSGPRVPFSLRVRGAPGYSSTTFRVGARNISYSNGEENWVSLVWPGEEATKGVALSVTPYSGAGPRPLAINNPWGLFMILQPSAGAQVFERKSTQLSVGWRPKVGQNYVKVDIASDDPRSPLMAAPFGGSGSKLFPLHPPARITHLGAACSGNGS